MADHPLFPVSVVTPEGPAFEGEAEMLIVPGDAGEIGVLARHAPLVAMLKAGSTRVHLEDGEVREFAPCDQYTIQGDLFSRALREGTAQPIPLEDALKNMATIDAVFRSAKSGRWEAPEF